MSARFVEQTRWKNTLNRHGTDGILLSRGLKKHTHKTLTESTRKGLVRSCSRAPRLSSRCVEQTRWEEHTEPTWHRWDRVCTSLKKNTHKTFTEPTDMAQIGSCLLEDATFCLQDAWSKQDESSTLKRKQHGTDGIVFARSLRKNTQDFY